MNVITLASRKGGAGKSTLTVHLAAQAHGLGYRTLIIDADPQGSLSLWHGLRRNGELRLASAAQGIARALAFAQVEGVEWVFIDTPPSMRVVVTEAIRAATLVVIPARPGFFDLAAVRETVELSRTYDKPYAVVINAAPVKRDEKDSPAVAQSRTHLDKLAIPVWSGQVSQRAGFALSLAAGAGVTEVAPSSAAAVEVKRLWTAVSRSVEAVNGARASVPGVAPAAPQAGVVPQPAAA
jgi:chromosome partitioning protein